MDKSSVYAIKKIFMSRITFLLLMGYQIAICFITPMEVYIGILILQLMILLFITLNFWLQIQPSVKYREPMEQAAEASYEFTMRVFRIKAVSSKTEGKYRVQISLGAAVIFVGIALIAYLIIFLEYVSNNLSIIISSMIKLTRVSGLMLFIGSIVLLFINLRLRKKRIYHYIPDISINGLIGQVLLLSMILIVF